MSFLEVVVNQIQSFFVWGASFIWGPPLLILLLGGGCFFLFYSGFVPFRHIGHAVGVLRGKFDHPGDIGQISHFQALSTALAACVGMGNISGVAVAITLGGPGAIFWMWVVALVGMATKYFTCTLAILYRGKDSSGEVQGGPMYVIVEGLGKRWKPLAIFFCVAGLFGCLPVFQANQLTQAIQDILLTPNGIESSFSVKLTIGVVLCAITAVVVLGGIQRIADVASKAVPIMVGVYFIAVLGIVITNIEAVPHYLSLILSNAFTADNYQGDPLFGGALGGLILLGARRAAFSNEAGIGTAPMAHGAAKTNQPVHEGLVAMLGPAIDTIIVCTLTALAILMTGVWQTTGDNGVTLTANAFTAAYPGYGQYILLVCIVAFSASTLFTLSYFGSKCLNFLMGAHRKHYFHYFYLATILVGATSSLTFIISIIDLAYGLMAFPTMISALILAPKVKQVTRDYFVHFDRTGEVANAPAQAVTEKT